MSYLQCDVNLMGRDVKERREMAKLPLLSSFFAGDKKSGT